MKRKFAIKEVKTNQFLIYEVIDDEKVLIDEVLRHQYEIDKFLENNKGVIVEKELISEVKNDTDKRGLLFD